MQSDNKKNNQINNILKIFAYDIDLIQYLSIWTRVVVWDFLDPNGIREISESGSKKMLKSIFFSQVYFFRLFSSEIGRGKKLYSDCGSRFHLFYILIPDLEFFNHYPQHCF